MRSSQEQNECKSLEKENTINPYFFANRLFKQIQVETLTEYKVN